MTLASWLPLAMVCLLGAMSPGPSLAVVMGNTLRQGYSAGYIAALSHGVGVALYGLITVAGLAALITGSPMLFSALQIAGALYLIYLGYKSLRSRSVSLAPADTDNNPRPRHGNAASEGFLVAFLNPKLAVFMLALFSQFLSADSTWTHRWIMVLTVGILDACWYSLVVAFVSRESVLTRLRKSSVVIDRVLGIVLILLAFTVLISTTIR